MNRGFSQISFDFSTPPSEENAAPAVTPPVASIENEEKILPDNEIAEYTDTVPVVTFTPVEKKKSGSGRGRKSQKTFAADADLVEVPEDDILFQKQYYPIGEVSHMFKVNASLLRFWEAEFDILKPRKNRKGDRLFRPVDIKNLQLIYDLLRRRKLTIEGAKDFLKNSKKSQEKFEMIQSLKKIKSFLLEIKASL